MRIIDLNEETVSDILGTLLKRNPGQYREYEKTVNDIIENVRERGDDAVFEYTARFDHWEAAPDNIRVTDEEIERAYSAYDTELIHVMERAASNIRKYHEKQLQNSWFDTDENGTIKYLLQRSGNITLDENNSALFI